MDSINKRIREIRKHFCNDKNLEFAKKMEKNANTVNNWIREGYSIGKGVISDILNKFPQIESDWLLTGEGEMLKDDKASDIILTGKLIPLFDADAAAGLSYGMNMEPSRQVGLIDIGGMLRDSETAIRVYGNSMIPNYPPGCVIGLRPHYDSFIVPGKVYVVETRDDRYLKRLYYTKDKMAFRCLSDNTKKHTDGPMEGEFCFPDFEIPLDEVIRVFKVVGVIKRNNM